MLERWTRAVLRFRLVVLACWLAVLGVGIYSSTQLPALLSNSFAVPGTDSERARGANEGTGPRRLRRLARREARARARSLARRRRALVVVINVIPAQSVSSRLVTVSDAERLRQDRLLRRPRSFSRTAEWRCRLIAAVGDPTAEILAAVEESGARWLVVGRGDRRHRLRRSVSVKLARAAKCDLVFVH